MIDVMHDVESLDTMDTAVVVSIGAVRFSSSGLGDTFYQVLDLEDQVRHGRTISPSTMKWWMGQSALARAVFDATPTDPVQVLTGYARWLAESGEDVRVWGNGAAFDNTMVASLFRSYNLPVPWRFYNNRCHRTLKNLVTLGPGEGIQFVGTAHNALDDAIYQAEMAIRLIKKANLAWR